MTTAGPKYLGSPTAMVSDSESAPVGLERNYRWAFLTE